MKTRLLAATRRLIVITLIGEAQMAIAAPVRRLEGTLWGGSGAVLVAAPNDSYKTTVWATPGSDSQDRQAEAEYRQQLGDPNSYARQAMGLPEQLVQMQTAVRLGNVARGKAIYDSVTKFFADHSSDVVRGMALSVSHSPPFIQSIQSASVLAGTGQIGSTKLVVDGVETDAQTFFGPGGDYQKHMDVDVRQKAGFSKEVSEAMAVGDDKSRLLGRIVDPFVKEFRKTGRPKIGVGQYHALAERILQGEEVIDLGFDAMDVIVDDVLRNHMTDGTALWRYDLLTSRLRAISDASPDGFDGIEEAQKLCCAVSAFERNVAGDSDERLTNAVSRAMIAFLCPVLERDPDVNLESPALVNAVGDVAEMAARLKRGGVELLPLMSNETLPVLSNVVAYIVGRTRGVRPDRGDFFVRLGDANVLVAQLVTSDWHPVTFRSRGNPNEVGWQAVDVLQRSSGLRSLDSVGVEFYRSFMPEVIERLGKMDAVSAIADAFADNGVRRRMANAISGSMGVPKSAAEQVYREIATKSVTSQGLVKPLSLDRVIGEIAFGYTTDPARIAAMPALAAWYERNVGETGAYFDSLLDGDWNPLLNDSVVGPFAGFRGNAAQRQDEIDRYKRSVRAKMVVAVRRGGSPHDVVRDERNKGNFIEVIGYVDANGVQHDMSELNGLDEKTRKAKLRGARPVLEEVGGRLDSMQQTISGWKLPDGTYLPTIAPRSWSDGPASRQNLINAQRQLRRLYMRQLIELENAMAVPICGGKEKRTKLQMLGNSIFGIVLVLVIFATVLLWLSGLFWDRTRIKVRRLFHVVMPDSCLDIMERYMMSQQGEVIIYSMKFVPVALPILGLIGFVNHMEWLFYVAGGLSALGTISFALSRPLSFLGAGVVVCLIIGYNCTGAFLIGIILGSCIAGLFAIPMFIMAAFKK